jgi:hypothetical protein
MPFLRADFSPRSNVERDSRIIVAARFNVSRGFAETSGGAGRLSSGD